MIANYSVKTYNSSGEIVADLTGLRNSLNIKKARNEADSINLVFDVDKLKEIVKNNGLNSIFDLLQVNVNEIRVFRDDTVISAGQISEIYSSIDGDTKLVNVRVVGWFDLLGQRYTDESRIFSSTDAGTIAWTLIDEAQTLTNGNIGITQGTITTSVNRDRTYSYKNIKEAIIQLSEVINGFDFEITWDKRFNVYYPSKGSAKNIILTYPGNIQSINYARQGLQVFNSITARGFGFGEDAPIANATDLTMQNKHKLREKIIDYNDIKTVSVLQDHADEELQLAKDFSDIPTITLVSGQDPETGTYTIGDTIKVRITEHTELFGVLNDTFKIEEININVNQLNDETVVLGLSR